MSRTSSAPDKMVRGTVRGLRTSGSPKSVVDLTAWSFIRSLTVVSLDLWFAAHRGWPSLERVWSGNMGNSRSET